MWRFALSRCTRSGADGARHRRRWLWIAVGSLAAPSWLACSLQNFGYLTADATDSGADAGGATDSGADAGGEMDADGSAGVDASQARDGGATDAMPDRADVLDGGDGVEAGGPTNYIVNPNFDNYSLAGWTFVPASAEGTTAFAQAPVGTATTPQGQADELAFYSATDAYTVDVSQTLTNLPDGTYTFAGYFNCGALNQTYIYAKGCQGADGGPDGGEQMTDIPMPPSSIGWEQVTITGIQVSGGTCTVGFFVNAQSTQYLNADGFSFELIAPTDSGAADAGPG